MKLIPLRFMALINFDYSTVRLIISIARISEWGLITMASLLGKVRLIVIHRIKVAA